jgi:hypothetical protein
MERQGKRLHAMLRVGRLNTMSWEEFQQLVAVVERLHANLTDFNVGVIVAYDCDGVFFREIGKLGNESFFHSPRGIAVDASNGRLYVVDPPRDALFTLDLKGNVLSRVGRDRGYPIGRYASPPIDLDLHEPTEVALGTDKLVVLDSMGSRILLMDLQCNLLS